MLRFKTYQKLYNGDYGWIVEEYGELNEAAIAPGTFKDAGRGIIDKNIDMADNATENDTWVLQDKSPFWKKGNQNKVNLTSNGKKTLEGKIMELRGISEPSKFASGWSEIFKSGNAYIQDIEAKIDDNSNVVKLAINDLDKTKSFSKELTPAERTARQESLSAISIMLADTLKNKGITEIPLLGDLENSAKYGKIVNNVFQVDKGMLQKFTDYFWIDKKKASPTSHVGRTFEQIMEFLYLDSSWLEQAKKTIETVFNESDGAGKFAKSTGIKGKSYQVHRGTDFMSAVYSVYKALAKHSGIDSAIIKDDKWNPGDVWMVEESKIEKLHSVLKDIIAIVGKDGDRGKLNDILRIKSDTMPNIPSGKKFENSLHFYNWLIKEWYDSDLLKGVSLKKFGDDGPDISHFNANPQDDFDNINVFFDEFYVGKNKNSPFKTKDIYLKFHTEIDGEEKKYSIQLRSFDSKIQAIQGEMKGANANHGKIGLGVIRYMMNIGERNKDFNKWRGYLAKIYASRSGRVRKSRNSEPISAKRVSASSRESLASLKSKYEKNKTNERRISRLLGLRIVVLHNYLLGVNANMSGWEDAPIDRLVSKIQALEVCAWLKNMSSDESDLVLKRMYFYATSRGNIETGAFSSKFMKIG